MRPVLRRLALIGLPILILLIPASVSAFPLTNCTVELTSLDANGGVIDSATQGANDGTQQDPFLLDYDGSVAWVGTMGPLVIKDHSWGVSVFGIPTPESGSDANEAGDVDGDGTVVVSDSLPFRFTGLYYVTGQISGTGGSCEGSGWVKLSGNPLGTLPFWLALALIALGAYMLWLGYRRGAGWAIFGGLILGLGVAVMLTIFSVMLVGTWTPLATILVGLLLGVVVVFIRPDREVAAT